MPHSCVWLTTNSTVRTLGAHSLASLACVIFPYSARCSYFICDVAMSIYISCQWNSFHRIRFHFRHLPHRARYKIGWCARDNKSRNAKPTHSYCGWNHSPVRMLCGVSHGPLYVVIVCAAPNLLNVSDGFFISPALWTVWPLHLSVRYCQCYCLVWYSIVAVDRLKLHAICLPKLSQRCGRRHDKINRMREPMVWFNITFVVLDYKHE